MSDGDESFGRWSRDFIQGVISDAETDEEGALREEVFTDHVIDLLREFGVVDDAEVCPYQTKGMKVSGYGFSQDDHILDLIVAHCDWKPNPEKVPRSVIAATAKLARNFLTRSLDGYYKNMEEATRAFDLAQRIHELRGELDTVRLYVVTDGVVTGEPLQDDHEGEIEVAYNIWDMERLFRCDSSGGKREAITINFEDFGGPILCRSEEDGSGVYTSYVAIVPGTTLGAIYEKWGTRMLEKNVRSFLQARGKVNQGIRNTILNEPHMFLTYNNGISVTAASLETKPTGDGTVAIRKATDFQIVNGGQTIASLYHAQRKDKADLSAIRVAMKLTLVHHLEDLDQIVPQISRFANTQNKVNLADFAANDPFHREVEEFSRTVWAPDPAGGKRLTHWFYERARGQYLDDRSRAPSERTFQAVNPKEQVFTKTDLAKFENTWSQLPYIVSRGAQKNFAEFSAALRERGGFKTDQTYFENLVAKAIMFRQAEKIVGAQRFGGYRANIVTYSLALISHATGQRIDLHAIWEKQAISDALRRELERLAPIAHKHITHPAGGQNITEWCKKEECWETLLLQEYSILPALTQELISMERAAATSHRRAPRVLGEDSEDAARIRRATEIPARVWLEMSHWGSLTKCLEPWQNGILYSVGKWIEREKPITGPMAKRALEAYEQAVKKGFKPQVVGS